MLAVPGKSPSPGLSGDRAREHNTGHPHPLHTSRVWPGHSPRFIGAPKSAVERLWSSLDMHAPAQAERAITRPACPTERDRHNTLATAFPLTRQAGVLSAALGAPCCSHSCACGRGVTLPKGPQAAVPRGVGLRRRAFLRARPPAQRPCVQGSRLSHACDTRVLSTKARGKLDSTQLAGRWPKLCDQRLPGSQP